MADASRFVVVRHNQSRAATERPLPVTGPSGALGHFKAELGGTPAFVLVNSTGQSLLRVSYQGPTGALVVGRGDGLEYGTVRPRDTSTPGYDLTTDNGEVIATVDPAGADRWELRADGVARGSLERTILVPSDAGHLAGVRYEVEIALADDGLLALVLATPLAIDVLETQKC